MSLNQVKIAATSCAAGLLALAATGIAAPPSKAPKPAVPAGAQAVEFFEARVRPVLAEHCFGCHGPEKQRAGLRLDSRAALLKGSDTGPVVVAGNPDQSALVRAIRYEGEVKMPPKGKLPPETVEVLTAWVKMGAPWPDTPAGVVAQTTADAIALARKNHWAFRPVRRA
jgi:mono/diheme cytochrome c family protein